MNTELPSLDEYVDLETLHPSVTNTFPTQQSIRWFLRGNRDALVEHGALIVVAGRLRFHPARFKMAAVAIGQKAAAPSHGGAA